MLELAATFWDDDASPGLGFLELLVLAHQGDELFAVELEGLFAKLDALALPSASAPVVGIGEHQATATS